MIRLKFGLELLLLLLLSACASTERRATRQTILVQSHPSGAQIFDANKNILGTTPAYVQVRRGRHTKLFLTEGDETRVVELQRKYRWSDSFWSNFMFLYGAPIGWTVDLSTGTAWEMKMPDIVEFDNLAVKKVIAERPKIVIAPPESESMQLSDEGGKFWQEKLTQQFPDMDVIPYQKSLGIFNKYQYDFDSKEFKKDRPDLLRELNARYLFESNFKQSNLGLELNGQAKDIYTDETLTNESLYFDPNAEPKKGFSAWYTRWIHILPNTPSFEFSNHKTRLNVDGEEHGGDHIYGSDPFSQVFRRVSISILHLDPPRVGRGSYWHFEFAPAVQLRFSEMQFDEAPSIASTQFNYFLASVGYGPEVGWKRGPHYIYLNAAPLWGYHQLTWHDQNGKYSIEAGRITSKAEIGYLVFLGQTNLKVFGRTVSEPTDIWNSAVKRISNGASSAQSAVDTFVGVSIGYTFVPKETVGRLIK